MLRRSELLTFAFALLVVTEARASTPCGSGWVFFDLGKTVIDTSDWNHLKYMPEAREYLRSMHEKGYHIGAITNVPEKWGKTLPDKIATLKSEVGKAWSETEPFNWDHFEMILVPPSDRERKPHPYLFDQAKQFVKDCPAIYMGEDPLEITSAKKRGLKAFLVGKTQKFFLSIKQLALKLKPKPKAQR